MKKISISLMSFVFAIQCIAQTNTFPSSGNVGIGVSSPTCKLDVDGSVRTTGAIRSSDGFYFIKNGSNSFAGGGYFQLSNSAGTDGYLLQNNASNGLDFWSTVSGTNSNRMTLASNGNVGIGTINPLVKLHVTGTVYANTIESATAEPANLNGSFCGPAGYWQIRGGTDHSMNIDVYNGNSQKAAMTVIQEGNIGIGTTSPTEKLSVNGNISAKKIIVTQTGWSDYVFNSDYKLRSLSSLETFINQNKHLPGVPSAKEVGKNGIDMGSTQALLLKKIEELTLYIINQQKKIDTLYNRVQQLEIKNVRK